MMQKAPSDGTGCCGSRRRNVDKIYERASPVPQRSEAFGNDVLGDDICKSMIFVGKRPEDFWGTNGVGLFGFLKGESLIPGLAYFYVSPKLDEVKWLIDRPASMVRVAMMLVICRLAYVDDCVSFRQLMVAGPSEIFGCSHDGGGMRRRYEGGIVGEWEWWRSRAFKVSRTKVGPTRVGRVNDRTNQGTRI